MLDKKKTLDSKADYLASKLARMEKGEEVSVLAEVEGKLAGNAEVIRGKMSNEFHHGKLGISLMQGYRDIGIGLEMTKVLVEESKKIGLKTIELEEFANNPRAIHVYERARFKQVGTIPNKIYRHGKFT